MRFKIKQNHLEKRQITKFAWIPIFIKSWDKREIIWLEHIKIEQTWYAFGDDLRVSFFGGYWENDRLIKC